MGLSHKAKAGLARHCSEGHKHRVLLFLFYLSRDILNEHVSDFSFQEFRQKLLSREEKFRELKKHKLVLDRKIGEKQDDDIVNSVVGTFRKLDV